MRLLVAMLLVLTPMSAIAQATIDPIVAITQQGSGYWFAIDQSGNLFRNTAPPGVEMYWILEGRIPEMAGRVEPAPFVGLSFWAGYPSISPCALTSTGEYYWFTPGISTWNHQGNIAQMAGHQNEGPFVSLTFSAYPAAITSLGEVYDMPAGAAGIWRYRGSIPQSLGVVPNQQVPLGGVKSMFR